MKTSRLLILGFISTTVLATAAQSEERWPRWYVGLSGSVNFVQDTDFSGTGANADVELDTGYGGTIALGYLPPVKEGFFSKTRFELEGGYRTSDFDSIEVGGVSAAAAGEYHVTSVMANAYYDFGNYIGWIPYVGLGGGMASIEIDTPNSFGTTNDKDDVFAYQAMVGIGYAPATLPQTEWSVGYRYFGTEDPEFGNAVGKFEGEYGSHNIEAGVKLRF